MQLTDADYVVLGFLLFRPMTGYELKAIMDQTTGHFYRPSFGGIYPSLGKLAREKLAAVSRSELGGKLKKIYRPLPAGRKAFLAWLKIPPDITRGPGLILAKMFFWGRLDRGSAKAQTAEIRRLARDRSKWLEGIGKAYADVADSFQIATSRFGIEYYRFLDEWFGEFQEEL